MSQSQLNAIVIRITLEGPNYPEWAFCVETALRGHGLLHHLTDNAPKPKEDGSNATAVKDWGINDGKVMATMVNSTKQSLIMSLSKFKTAKAIWENLKQRYVQDSGALLHSLMQQTHVIEQNDMSIDEYIQDLIARSGITDSRTAATPMDLHLQLRPTDGVPLKDPSRYRHIVGSLVYLTVTRPDIAHAVHILSQFVCAPTSVHFGHLLRVLRYLRGTSSQSLLYAHDSPLQLHAYSDSTWASDPTDRCSITGYCILLGSSIAWKSKKQAAVSRSSTEAELRALATTTAEIVWLRWLLADLGISCDVATPLLCDNTGAIQIANDPVKHELTKHIGVDAFFTRSHCHQKTISLQYVPSELQLADFFTKAQTREQHRLHLIKLNALDPPLSP